MPSLARWQLAERHWAARQREAAEGEYRALLADPDWVLPASLRLGAIAMGRGDVRGAVEHALQAHAAREPDPVLLEALCRLLLDVGELRAALDCIDDPAMADCTDPAVLLGTSSRSLAAIDSVSPTTALELHEDYHGRGAQRSP